MWNSFLLFLHENLPVRKICFTVTQMHAIKWFIAVSILHQLILEFLIQLDREKLV